MNMDMELYILVNTAADFHINTVRTPRWPFLAVVFSVIAVVFCSLTEAPNNPIVVATATQAR